ncbi:D-alanine--D-alanine ligase, partial [Dysosmobacter welbionis]
NKTVTVSPAACISCNLRVCVKKCSPEAGEHFQGHSDHGGAPGAEALIEDDANHQHKAGDVGGRAGDHHTQAAHSHGHPQQRGDGPVQESVEGRRHAEDAQQGADADLHHLEGTGHIHKEHLGAESEDVRHDKGRYGQFRGVEPCLHGIRLGNGAAGIGRQGHRRRDVRHNAEVEHEEVGRHLGDTDGGIHQDGSAGGRHDAVVGGGRHAHAQHDAAEHGQRQGDNHVAAGEADDCAQQLGGQARHRDAAGDNAGHAAGHRHSDGALGAALQGVDDLAEGEEVLPVAALAGDLHHVVDQAYGHGRHDCDGSGEGHGVHIGGDHDHQQHQGRQKVDLGQQLAHAGQLLSGNALQ